MKKGIQSFSGKLLFISIMLFAVAIGFGCQSSNPTHSAVEQTDNPTKVNNYPVVQQIILEYTAIGRGTDGRIICVATDPDGDKLTYTWKASRGLIKGKGSNAEYSAPLNYGDVTVTITVTDGKGGTSERSITFPVVCCGYIQKNPEWSE